MIKFGKVVADFTKAQPNDTFWMQVSPDGVNGHPPVETRVTWVEQHWGLRDIGFECTNGAKGSFTLTTNWWGRVRMWLYHLQGRLSYLWHTYGICRF